MASVFSSWWQWMTRSLPNTLIYTIVVWLRIGKGHDFTWKLNLVCTSISFGVKHLISKLTSYLSLPLLTCTTPSCRCRGQSHCGADSGSVDNAGASEEVVGILEADSALEWLERMLDALFSVWNELSCEHTKLINLNSEGILRYESSGEAYLRSHVLRNWIP